MKNIIVQFFLGLSLIVFVWTNADAQNLSKQQKNGKYGVVNSNGQVVIPFQYQYIEIHSFCVVSIKGTQYQVLTHTGAPFLSGSFDRVEVYEDEGYIVAKANKRYAIYNKQRKRITSDLTAVDKIHKHRTAVKYQGQWYHWERGEILKNDTSPIYFARVAQFPTLDKATTNSGRSQEILDSISMIVYSGEGWRWFPDTKNYTETVIVDIYISKTGEITKVGIVESVSEFFDAKAQELVKELGKFKKPALKKNAPVNCKLRLPIQFIQR